MGLEAADSKQAISNFLTDFFFILGNPDMFSVSVYGDSDQSVAAANADTLASEAFHIYNHEYLNYINYI